MHSSPYHQPVYSCASSSSSSSSSPETPPSIFDQWADSSSSSPEAMLPYQQPWAVEPAMNCSLFQPQPTVEPSQDGLPRVVPSMGRCNEWPGPLMASNYSSSRQLKPEMRRLPAGKHLPDWAHSRPSEAASFSLYKASHPLPPHSHSSSSSNPATTIVSPPSTSMPYQSLPLSVVSPPIKLEMDRDVAPTASADEAEDTNADPPYSQLIYEALSAAPGKKLPLQGIYLWFEKNTAKGRDRGSKGWQNSIRHNLSMNAGFEAVREESTPGKKAVNYWRLTDEAVSNGIQSTTRYRKQTNYKKPIPSEPPAPQRQRSGAKGGKATKITARFRSNGLSINSMSQEDYRRERAYRQQHHYQLQNYNQRVMPSQRHLPKGFIYSQYLHRPPPTTTTAAYAPGVVGTAPTTLPMTAARSSAIDGFNLSNIVGCTDAPPCTSATPIFCDMAGPSPDCLVFDAGFMGMDGIDSSFASSEISTTDLHIGL
ncbi:hypothetical protein BDW74DRAFT_176906 [Aspergillus multicolor]|uniref:uncharacterized protein n=1 Tax=Aspergillus multicolor TaxID=41759 RepID=UPI003CCE2428